MPKFYNYLTRKKEEFKPLRKDRVGLYTCGPTVYNSAHIGNLRTYVFEDVLRRTLEYAGYRVKHVMNITDVGHLTSDADEGEDKLEKGARAAKKTVWDVAKFYTESFLEDIEKINVKRAKYLVPATSTVKEQITLIKKLFQRGFAYNTPEAVYFDISKFKDYTKLSRQKLDQKVIGARKEVVTNTQKRNSYDFALWFKLTGRFKNHTMRWPSPWGEGFPGWHIECSAISTKYLGQPFDIHTGGVDHINVHHTNEIAQSEGAYGKKFVKYFVEGEHLLVDGEKMSKSLGNFYALRDIEARGFDPMTFRYLILTSHYRSKLNFTWKSLGAAQNSLNRLYDFIYSLKSSKPSYRGLAAIVNKMDFEQTVFDDLNTPKALAAIWKLIHDYNKNPLKYGSKEVLRTFYDFDKILGLRLKESGREKIPAGITELSKKRKEYRKNKKWKEADEIREKIKKLGYLIEDTEDGPKITKK